jgi:aryl-alcohol dehydrogenase-like predicted oxidoreductase
MTIPKLAFGRSGHMSTRTVFGAVAVGQVSQAEADRTLDLLLEYGINHIDTAADYGDSELRIGPWMAEYRDHFFLATKTSKRTYAEAKEQFERSLERLRVDAVDMVQLHHLVDEDEWQTALGPGGALEYLIEARAQGLTRHIGVTGHEVKIVEMHRRSLEHFDFDAILLPYNYLMMQNPTYAAGFNELLRMCQGRNTAVQTIKSLARRTYRTAERTHATWYEPLTEQAAIDRAVHWVLAQPGIFLNTTGDLEVLPKLLDAASRFDPQDERPSDAEMEAIVERQAMEPLFT